MAHNGSRKAPYANEHSHVPKNRGQQQPICHQYARTGFCRFRNCKYLHIDKSENERTQSSNGKHNGTMSNGKEEYPSTGPHSNNLADFLVWRKDAALKALRPRPLGSRLSYFFTEARRLMKLDVGLLQDVVICLSSSKDRVAEMMLQPFDMMSKSEKRLVFQSQAMPFIEIFSDRTVLTPMMLRSSVFRIYSDVFTDLPSAGLVPFLNLIIDTLATATDIDITIKCQHLEAVFTFMCHAIEHEVIRDVSEPMKKWRENLEILVDSFRPSLSVTHFEVLQNYLAQVNRGFEAVSMHEESSIEADPDHPITKYTPQSDRPGGRHDNDFGAIEKIEILPTLDEILSQYPEYLPGKDCRQWHTGGVAGLLDRNFRLLREDTVGQLRDAVRGVIQPSSLHRSENNQLKTRIYHKVRIVSFHLRGVNGFQFEAIFEQPAQVRGLVNEEQRREWWQRFNRLEPGSLVCLCKAQAFATFCTTVAPPKTNTGSNESCDRDVKKTDNLWSDRANAHITLELAQFNRESVQSLLHQSRCQDLADSATLIEFPGILLQAFQPTLNALQRFSRSLNFPFSDFLASPIAVDHHDVVSVPPPIYATSPGFFFDLRCLMKDSSSLELRPGEPFDLKRLQDNSTLDDAQAVALVDSLQRSIGLIQGPPGTGKSFTGVVLVKVLLANKSKVQNGLGPIICVCYTNHALDQLLEDFLDNGITNIVRIGSQSKSNRLQPFNIRTLAQKTARTKAESRQHYNAYRQSEENETDFRRLRLDRLETEVHVMEYLRRNQPERYKEMYGEEICSDWLPNPKKIPDEPSELLTDWLRSGEKDVNAKHRALGELEYVPMESMNNEERHRIWKHWEKETHRSTDTQAFACIFEHFEIKEKFDSAKNELNLRCLRNADIIGVTTSGLARNLHLVSCLEPKVVLCEEAGEVLEAHLLATLLPSVGHLILIGDHLQLRPQIQNYELSCEHNKSGVNYSLDVSLFERLVLPEKGQGVKLPFSTLDTQRRMHPSISHLIRATLYPKLKDSPSVCLYPTVVGIRKRLFWLDHRKPEASTAAGETSHWNQHEIDLTSALVIHIVRQGVYESKDIAVLTPYLGQLHRLRQKLAGWFAIDLGEQDRKNLDIAGFAADGGHPHPSSEKTSQPQTLRAATVDNFQGEEAKVVVISLVRSNAENQCGFLRTSNRINVLLSRAKHGMYIVGNSETSKHVPMWAKVIDILHQNGNIGTALELQCRKHPEAQIAVSEPGDFARLAPDGGCHLRCPNRLVCGHACPQKCHPDAMHAVVRCVVSVYDGKRALSCGHLVQALPCWQARNLKIVKCHKCPASSKSGSHTLGSPQTPNGDCGVRGLQDSLKRLHI